MILSAFFGAKECYMKKNHGSSVFLSVTFLLLVLLNIGCSTEKSHKVVDIPNDSLPPPNATPSKRNFSKVLGWKDGKTPIAPEGFTVSLFADSLQHPRWIYVADNGDIFVSESSTILRFKKFLLIFHAE
jgi:glucose/arabinose dehydrogenase